MAYEVDGITNRHMDTRIPPNLISQNFMRNNWLITRKNTSIAIQLHSAEERKKR